MLRIAATLVLLAASLAFAAPAPKRGAKPAVVKKGPWTKKAEAGKDLWATLHTSEGDIVVRLFSKDAPQTVANFVGLASGEKEWLDPQTGEPVKRKPLYTGVIFHRVIPNFMIQGGDPSATGRGGPGYAFGDELQSGRKFDKPGLLAMANAGPDTNGSQFFITVGETQFLTGRHTIFGEVVQGYDVAVRIANVPRDRMDRPNVAVTLQKVVLSDKPPKSPPADKPEQAAGKPVGKGTRFR